MSGFSRDKDTLFNHYSTPDGSLFLAIFADATNRVIALRQPAGGGKSGQHRAMYRLRAGCPGEDRGNRECHRK
jgi:hypothetical protein